MRLFSRKNVVTLEQGIITKRFNDQDAYARELSMLIKLGAAGVAVPALLKAESPVLTLEYIKSPTYYDMVDFMTEERARALSKWMQSYYAASGVLRGDVNLRNFLSTEGGCVGIDFEDVPKQGEPEKDMGRLIAYACTYDPALTNKKLSAARFFFRAFLEDGADAERIKFWYLDELMKMEKRRGPIFSIGDEACRFWKEIAGR